MSTASLILALAACCAALGALVGVAGMWLLFRDFLPSPLRDREHGP